MNIVLEVLSVGAVLAWLVSIFRYDWDKHEQDCAEDDGFF